MFKRKIEFHCIGGEITNFSVPFLFLPPPPIKTMTGPPDTDLPDVSEGGPELVAVPQLASDPARQPVCGAGPAIPRVTQHHTRVVVPRASETR